MRQNLLYHCALHGIRGREARRRTERALQIVGLADRAREKVRNLSGGQARRVEIARSLLHQPSLLLLDEPTVGLDIGSRESVINIVRSLVEKEGLGVLWATHLFDEVRPTDLVVLLHKGRVLFTGSVPDLLAKTATQIGQRRIPQVDRHRHHGARRMTAVTATAPRQMSVTTSISDRAWGSEPPRLGLRAYITCFKGIVWREVLRYLHQRERFMSALVRPLIWLFIFAAGFRQTLGVSIIPPYETYVLYEVYVVPGLLGMILLFNAMQSSLSMVYDRETGAMRTLLVSPFPRSFLLVSKLIGGVAVAAIQAYVFLGIFYFWEAELSGWGYPLLLAPPALLVALIMFNSATEKLSERFMQNALIVAAVVELAVIVWRHLRLAAVAAVDELLAVAPALVISGLMLGSLALFMSSVIKQLENFAGVMNFVIFPMFFASSALYPLWRVKESSLLLYQMCLINPFTHAVELIRFALYGQVDWPSLAIVLACTAVFLGAAIFAYNPSKGLIARRGGPGSGA